MSTEQGAIAGSKTNSKPARFYYLDWMRVLAMGSIFFFHNLRAFDFGGWHIKNPQTSIVATVIVDFFSIWMMPLFFVLSGAAVYYSLKKRTAGGFVKERSLRIALPWLLTGIFLIAPPQIYLERFTHGQFNGSFFQFFPHYFEGFYGFGGNFAWMGVHLWYLMDLFIFTMLLLPLIVSSGKSGTSLLSRLANATGSPWVLVGLFGLFGVFSLTSGIVGLGSTEDMGSWDILAYLAFFISGYFIFSNERLVAFINRHGVAFFISGAAFAIAHMITTKVFGYDGDIDLRGLAAYLWVLGAIGVSSRFLNFNTKFLGYANEAVLPFYILHQFVIVILGFFIIQLGVGIPLKYALFVIGSFIVIMAIYELLVRRTNILRLLFGMRWQSRA